MVQFAVGTLGVKVATYSCCGEDSTVAGCKKGPHVFDYSSFKDMLAHGLHFVKSKPRPCMSIDILQLNCVHTH
jgi:hypothetical protein